ncbi:hypothetical protein BN2476_930008 [Paraburkholderia piptadeniae]|uniref:Uncharacterized protein n=1 Tax=Paraburkholderia piptadeniae TaxID=1701573 RepID=A0A1N7STL1_9BURK|nr:hypothetical protein BN2476_930008 [Paraburkholderia piptadeniae]
MSNILGRQDQSGRALVSCPSGGTAEIYGVASGPTSADRIRQGTGRVATLAWGGVGMRSFFVTR